LEYTTIFGIIAIALFAMSTYIRRSFQAQVKDMADNFISEGSANQAADSQVKSIATSNASSKSSSNMEVRDLLKGARSVRSNEVSESSSQSRVEDTRKSTDESTDAELSDASVVYQESNTSSGE